MDVAVSANLLGSSVAWFSDGQRYDGTIVGVAFSSGAYFYMLVVSEGKFYQKVYSELVVTG